MKHKVLIALFENGFVIYFCLCQVFVAACKLSLVAVSGGCSPVVMCRLLVLVASLVAQHRLCVAQACSIFLDQRLNLRWQVDSSPLDHRGSPPYSSQSHKTKTNWSSKYKIKLDSFQEYKDSSTFLSQSMCLPCYQIEEQNNIIISIDVGKFFNKI